MNTQNATDSAIEPPPRRPWWRRKWALVAIVVVALIVGGGAGIALNPRKVIAPASPSPGSAVAAASLSPTQSLPTSRPTSSQGPSASQPAGKPTPSPTPSPTPEPTLQPTPVPTPTPPILKTSGRGDKIVRLPAQDAPTIVRITGKGSSNFAVVSYVGSAYDDLLVNEIGSYSGTVYIAAGVSRLKISSSGTWTVEVRPIESARTWSGVGRLGGSGDSVVLLAGAASGITTIKNKSNSNFAVVAYSPEGDYLDLLVNEIGNYSGEILLPDSDVIVLAIHAVGGTWSMSPVEF